MESQQLDKYLNHVQETEIISELESDDWFLIGIGAFMVTILGLSIWGTILDDRQYPKHPKWNKMITQYRNMYAKCAKMYPDDYTKIKAGGGVGDISAQLEYEDYKANPEKIKCQLMVRLNHLKKFIKWISIAKAEEICKYNEKDKWRCYAYVMKVKETKIEELGELTRFISQSSKTKPMNAQQFRMVANVLNPKTKK